MNECYGTGTLWKGSIAEVRLPLACRRIDIEQAENVIVRLFTFGSEVSVEKTKDQMTLDGNIAVITLSTTDLDSLADGALRYSVIIDNLIVEERSSRYFIKTPTNLIPSGGGISKAEAQEMIDSALTEYNKTDNFKTINGETIIGEGDIEVKGGGIYKSLRKLDNYLYEIEYDSLDYDYANDYFENNEPESVGGCTCIVKDNLIGRNYDWLYDEEVSFVVRTPAGNGRYKVDGVAGSLSALTKDVVEQYGDEEAYKILPFYLQDGHNEYGLFAEMNVVPANGNTRTIPLIEKRDSVCAIALVRYILDNFGKENDTDEIIEYLNNYVEIYFPQTLIDKGFELHYMLQSVGNNPVVIEIYENHLVSIKNDNQMFLTNFRLYGTTLTGNQYNTPYTANNGNYPSDNGIETYGTGIERANIVLQSFDGIEDEYDMKELLENLYFSKAYSDLGNDTWYSEFVGGNITVDTPSSNNAFQGRVAQYRQKWEERSRSNPEVWITCHSSIYDLGSSKMIVGSQESDVYAEYYISTSKEVQKMIDASMTLETGRTESTYQKILTAGSGITIENNVISSTGGSGEEKNYQIVDALSAVTDYTEGTMAFVKTQLESQINGYVFDCSNVKDNDEGYIVAFKFDGNDWAEDRFRVYYTQGEGDLSFHWDWTLDGNYHEKHDGEFECYYKADKVAKTIEIYCDRITGYEIRYDKDEGYVDVSESTYDKYIDGKEYIRYNNAWIPKVVELSGGTITEEQWNLLLNNYSFVDYYLWNGEKTIKSKILTIVLNGSDELLIQSIVRDGAGRHYNFGRKQVAVHHSTMTYDDHGEELIACGMNVISLQDGRKSGGWYHKYTLHISEDCHDYSKALDCFLLGEKQGYTINSDIGYNKVATILFDGSPIAEVWRDGDNWMDYENNGWWRASGEDRFYYRKNPITGAFEVVPAVDGITIQSEEPSIHPVISPATLKPWFVEIGFKWDGVCNKAQFEMDGIWGSEVREWEPNKYHTLDLYGKQYTWISNIIDDNTIEIYSPSMLYLDTDWHTELYDDYQNGYFSMTYDGFVHVDTTLPTFEIQNGEVIGELGYSEDDIKYFAGQVAQDALTGYTPTSGMSTINGSSITTGTNVEVGNVRSAEISKIKKLTLLEYQQLYQKENDCLYIII